MTVVWGAVLAAGLLLTISPWVWPHRSTSAPRRPDDRVTRLLSEAGFGQASPLRLVVVCGACAAVSGAIVWLALPVGALAVVATVAGGCAPVLWLRSRRGRIVRSRRALWPDVCDLLVASVRAGMSLPDAVASLSESAPTPVRPAFAAFSRDLAASGHFSTSVVRMKSALADPVADRIVETLRMARDVGGTELAPVLRALSASVRADAALRAEVEARQSWIRGAAVLGVVAPWAILALLALRPEGAEAYRSAEGIVLILAGGAVSFAAYRIMLHIGRLPETRRWFA